MLNLHQESEQVDLQPCDLKSERKKDFKIQIVPVPIISRVKPKRSTFLHRILQARKELRVFGFMILLAIISFFVFADTSVASASSKTTLEKLKVSYLAIFSLVTISFFLLRSLELLLSKAGLLKSEHDVKLDAIHSWIFEDGGAKDQVYDTHDWHTPIQTDVGSVFTWKSNTSINKVITQIELDLRELTLEEKRYTTEIQDLKQELLEVKELLKDLKR